MRSKRVGIIVLMCFIHFNIQAQSNLDFIKYLSREDKRIELFSFIKATYQNSDSLNYFFAKYHLRFQEDSLFFTEFAKCKSMFLKDSNAVGYASCYFLRQQDHSENRNKWFNELEVEKLSQHVTELNSIYFLNRKNAKFIKLEDYPNVIRASAELYLNIAKKKPTKGALLSAFIPGMGKFYIKKNRIGLNTLFMNATFALQTYESIQKLGINNPLSIINLILSCFFYSANIYGSYRDVRYFQKENLQQFYTDASNFYSSEYFSVVF